MYPDHFSSYKPKFQSFQAPTSNVLIIPEDLSPVKRDDYKLKCASRDCYQIVTPTVGEMNLSNQYY